MTGGSPHIPTITSGTNQHLLQRCPGSYMRLPRMCTRSHALCLLTGDTPTAFPYHVLSSSAGSFLSASMCALILQNNHTKKKHWTSAHASLLLCLILLQLHGELNFLSTSSPPPMPIGLFACHCPETTILVESRCMSQVAVPRMSAPLTWWFILLHLFFNILLKFLT